ncbi:MAG: hypothetical protein HY904_07380 [Deltaproteobacteria bacterium]|nr:hypothetical protein [Deltaproteobacteria bacterium]
MDTPPGTRLLALLMLATACEQQGGVMPPEEKGPTGFAGSAPVVSVHPESEPGTAIRSVDTAAVVRARWTDILPGDHQRVELVAPNGRVYETVTVPIGPGGEAVARLAIAGTFVEEYRLYGAWTARFYYNGGAAPVKETRFNVEP